MHDYVWKETGDSSNLPEGQPGEPQVEVLHFITPFGNVLKLLPHNWKVFF